MTLEDTLARIRAAKAKEAEENPPVDTDAVVAKVRARIQVENPAQNKPALPGVNLADKQIELGNTATALMGPPRPRADLQPLIIGKSHGKYTAVRTIIYMPPSDSTE